MRCSPRPLTYVVKLLLVLALVSFGGVLDEREAKEIALRKVEEELGSRIKVERVSLILSRPVRYKKIERVDLSLREGAPRGFVHIYLLTDRGMRRISVFLDVLWKCKVLTATEDIQRGERIYPWQVSLENLYMKRCPRQEIENTEELINYVALRTITKGSIIKKSLFKREPLVRRGEQVNVIFRRGNLEISFTGEALENGFLGDVIRVKSSNTGKILRGRVVSEGSVLVR